MTLSLEDGLAQFNISLAQSSSTVDVYSCELRESLVTQFDEAQAAILQEKRKDRRILLLSQPPLEQGPTQNWSNLGPISLKEVASKVNHIWEDRILLVKAVRSPFQLSTGLFTLVEDEHRASVPLSLWNYLPVESNDEYSGASLNSEFPEGSFLAIANPLMVPNRLFDGAANESSGVMLRCDNPDCVRVFDSKEAWETARINGLLNAVQVQSSKASPPASLLKELGNAAFVKKKDNALALRYYKQALAVASASEPPETDIIISCLGNMSETYLNLGRYEEAEDCSRRILSEYDGNHFKAKFRLSRALLAQNKPEETKDILTQLRMDYPKNTSSLQGVLGECLQAIMEAKGKYNYKKMLGEAYLSPILPFHANFVSSQVNLGASITRPWDRESYRGVLANEDISEGTLLTASSAFAFAYQQGNQSSNSSARKKHQYEVSHVHQAVNAIRRNPKHAAAFYRLEAGGQMPKSSQDCERSAVDLPRIRSILESNRFGVDINSPSSPFTLKTSQEDDEEYVGVGLWLDVSMYNHSCTPNCTWAQIGNHMFVYACKDVKKGEELCIGYVHPALSYLDRKERFAKWSGGMGFECACEWCSWMRTSPSQFQEMNEEVKLAQMRMGSGYFSSFDELLSPSRRVEIRAAHADVPKRFQQTVYNVCMLEALQAASSADRERALVAVKEAAALGYAIRGGLRQETRVQDLVVLSAAHMTCNQDKEAQEALDTLCNFQVVLPPLKEFQNLVMTKSVQIWQPYQTEPFIMRWSGIIKKVWQQRSKQLK